MPTITKFPEPFNVYRMPDIITNDIGETIAPTADNLTLVGQINARVNTGDSLEPDVRGTTKNVGQDLTTMWLGWFEIPDGFDIETGDLIISTIDDERKFQVQFIDKLPGGVVPAHHWEARLQTTEIFRRDS